MTEEKRFYGISDQLTQVKSLQFACYDVVLSDRYIFRYFVKQMKLLNVLEPSKVEAHDFATVNPENYRPVFRDQQVRDDFNLGLKHLKATGEFQKIYDNYIGL